MLRLLFFGVLILSGACTPRKPYLCGTQLLCSCECAICTDSRSTLTPDGGSRRYCSAAEPMENGVRDCFPRSAWSADECRSEAIAAIDAGAEECSRACRAFAAKFAILQDGGIIMNADVIGCRPQQVVLIEEDDPACRLETGASQ